MKSKLSFFIPALFAILGLASCTKLEKVLVKKEGNWTVTRTLTRITTGSTVVTDFTDNNPGLTYNFKEDGTGTITESGSTTATNFSWTADDGAESITIVSSGNTTVWVLSENKAKSLRGSSTSSVTVFGVITTSYYEIDMIRVE